MATKSIPYNFVFDYLASVNVKTKPMFGMLALYVGEKIMLILRQRNVRPNANGVWIATKPEHHKSLKAELPSMCSISAFSKGLKETEWQVLPASADDFEVSVIKVCSMITHGDPRVGRIPKGSKGSKGSKGKSRPANAKRFGR